MRYKGEDRGRTRSNHEFHAICNSRCPLGLTFQAYISRRSLVLENEPDGSPDGGRFWNERFNFLFPLRVSNSGIFVTRDIVEPSKDSISKSSITKNAYRYANPSFFNIRVFQKCCERSRVSRGIFEKKSIKLVFSRVRRRRREDEFLLIWKLRFQLRKFTFKEGTNEISRVFHRVVARVSSFSLATFYLVTSMLLDEIFHTRNERYFFFNSPLFQEGQKSIRKTMTPFIPFYEGEYKNFIRNASKSFSISKFNERKI